MEEGRGTEEPLYKGLSRSSNEETPKKALTSPGPVKNPPTSPRPKWVDIMESLSRVPSRNEDPKYSVESPKSPKSPRANQEVSPMPPIAELNPTGLKPESPAPTKNYSDLLAARERAYSNETLRRQAEAQKEQQDSRPKERQESHTPQIPKKREEWMRSGSTRGPRYKDVLEVRPRAPSTQSTREVSRLVQDGGGTATMTVGDYEEPPPPPVRKDTKYMRKKQRPADLKIPTQR